MSFWETVGSKRYLILVGVSAFGLVGCAGGNQPAESASPADGADKTENGSSATTQLPPLVAAPAPDGVVARFRVQSPEKLTDGVFEALSIPFDWRRGLQEIDESEPYIDVIDLKAPIEGAVALNPRRAEEPFHFLSVGVVGVEQLLSALDKAGIPNTEAPGNVYRFKLDGSPCLVGRSMGASPARVVCSENSHSLLAISDYALRGLPNEKLSDAAVHFEADFRPIFARYGKELKRGRLFASVMARQAHIGNAKFDQALTDAAIGLAEEGVALLDDLETFTAQVYEKEGNFNAVIRTRFEGETSTTVQVLHEMEKSQKAAPELFERLPADSVSAGYSRELSRETAGSWFSIMGDLVAGLSESEGASPEFASHLASLAKHLGPNGNTIVSARGPMSVVTVKGEKQLDPGWSVIATTGDKKHVLEILDETSWLLASPELKKLLPEVTSLPRFARVNLTIPGAPGATVYKWTLTDDLAGMARELSAGTPAQSAVGLASALDKFKTGLVAVHSTGDATLLAWALGESREEIAAGFRALSDTSAPRLATVAELRDVRGQAAVAAGFAKLDGLVAPYAWLLPVGMALDWESMLRAAPHHGKVPMTYSFQVKSGQVTEAKVEMDIPVAFSQDLATMIALAIAEFAKK